MNRIKKWWEYQKAKTTKQRVRAIQEDFKIAESKGSIWLIHLGIAFKEFPSNVKASDIARALNEARQMAIKYEGFSADNALKEYESLETEHKD